MKLKNITNKLWNCIRSGGIRPAVKCSGCQSTKNSEEFQSTNKNKPQIWLWENPHQERPTSIKKGDHNFVNLLRRILVWQKGKPQKLTRRLKKFLSSLKSFFITKRRKALKNIIAIGVISTIPKALMTKTFSGPRTHFIGLGNSGGQILQYFLKKQPHAKFTCLTTRKPENRKQEIQYIYIPTLENKEDNGQLNLSGEFHEIFNSNDQFVLLAGLGGFSGSLLTKELTLKLHSLNRNFITICSLPFKFEGTKRHYDALKTINAISHLPQVKTLELDCLRQKYDDLMLSNCFDRGDREFWEVYKAKKYNGPPHITTKSLFE